MRYRRKPTLVEAVRFDGMNELEVRRLGAPVFDYWNRTKKLGIITADGKVYADPGDWVIKGTLGEFYVRTAEIFQATYELADPTVEQDPRGDVANCDNPRHNV